MGGFSIWHWLIVLVIVVLSVFIPFAMILHKAGYSRLWVVFFAIPIVNIIAIWVLALARWPNAKQ